MEHREIIQKLNSHLAVHPRATLQVVAESIGISPQNIEQILSEIEGKSFQEFRESKRLAQAFELLGASEAPANETWEKQRSRPRMIIPQTAVKYRIYGFWFRKRSFSDPCPVIDLNSGGLAFLTDIAPKPGKRVLILLTLPGRKETLRLKGRAVYAVATGIAGYRYRVGIKLLPYAARRGCNTPDALDVLVGFEKDYNASYQRKGAQ
jgi:AraC-like DNA-binding protein